MAQLHVQRRTVTTERIIAAACWWSASPRPRSGVSHVAMLELVERMHHCRPGRPRSSLSRQLQPLWRTGLRAAGEGGRGRCSPTAARGSRPMPDAECAMECAIGLVTTWHTLARPGTTAPPPSRHKLRHVAHLGTFWHNVARPGTTPCCLFESCRAYHFFARMRARIGGFEKWGFRVCNRVCNCPGHNLARPGTAWHDLARVVGGSCRADSAEPTSPRTGRRGVEPWRGHRWPTLARVAAKRREGVAVGAQGARRACGAVTRAPGRGDAGQAVAAADASFCVRSLTSSRGTRSGHQPAQARR
jgi:hypothetical protein